MFFLSFIVNAASVYIIPSQAYILEQYETMLNQCVSYDNTRSLIQQEYPAAYGGAYLGDDGLLHVNLTNTDKSVVSTYKNSVDASVVKFHKVTYSLEYLIDVHDLLVDHMLDLHISAVSVSQTDNIVTIEVLSEEDIAPIKALLNGEQIDEGCYEIVIVEGVSVACTDVVLQDENLTTNSSENNTYSTSSTRYFRPGDPVYHWDYGYAVTYATQCFNAYKYVNNTKVYGFVTAAHFWYNKTTAGDAINQLSTSSQASTNFTVDGTFIPFNSNAYGVTGRIYNQLYNADNSISHYYSDSTSTTLENLDCIAFGKTSGQTNIEITKSIHTYTLTNTSTNTSYSITGFKTSYYAQNGDSGGPVVYENTSGKYTLLGMTSATNVANNYSSCVRAVDIITALGLTICGGSN